MKLNHVNLAVNDLSAAAHFLETYFGLRRQFDSQGIIVLNDDDHLICTLMKAAQVNYPGSFHIGFVQESEQQVNAIYQRLKEDGFAVKPPQRAHSWTFYVQAPGGFTVEVLSRPGPAD
jgi:lactoylglutathione lyase